MKQHVPADYPTPIATPPVRNVSRSAVDVDPNSLPALSSLGLPHTSGTSSRSTSAHATYDVPPPDEASTTSYLPCPERARNDYVQNQINAMMRFEPSRAIGGETAALLRDISVDPTDSNAELFHLCTHRLRRPHTAPLTNRLPDFAGILPNLWSIDGESPAPPIINEFWIPFMSSSALLVHANLLRAAIWRAGNKMATQHPTSHDLANPLRAMSPKDSLEILTLKSKSISLLNERLRSSGGISVDDEAIVSVIFHFYNEVRSLSILLERTSLLILLSGAGACATPSAT